MSLGRELKTVGAAMRKAREPKAVLHLGTVRRQAPCERSKQYDR